MKCCCRLLARPLTAVLLLAGLVIPLYGRADTPSFEVHLGGDGQTLGDLRPAYIDLQSQALPHVSVNEVARRYEQLFKNATDPDVRIDALHRLLNLQSIPGTNINLSPGEEKIFYQQALKSYSMILDSGVYYGRMDELLYQMARAYDYVGKEGESDDRLEQLVGLYPNSQYAVEAYFRIGEYDFSQGKYQDAVKAYQTVLNRGKKSRFTDKARYMLGWSQYKAGDVDDASRTFINVLDRYYAQSDGFKKLGKIETETVEDTFRILSIIASYDGGAQKLNSLLAEVGNKPYSYLLYDRLADFYLSQQRYHDSVATDRAFLDHYPDNPHAPAIAAQIVATYEDGNFDASARDAKMDFVKRYGSKSSLGQLGAKQKGDLYDYLNDLGHWAYGKGQDAKDPGKQTQWFTKAGDYLEKLAELYPEEKAEGPTLLLAADAYHQAGDTSRALGLYQQAAYSAPDFKKAADAGYAAVLIRRSQWRQGRSGQALDDLTAESRHFTTIFPNDSRADAVRVHIANVLYDQGQPLKASTFANPVVQDSKATQEEKRAAWLVLANSDYDGKNYQQAEHEYRQASQLAPPAALAQKIRDKLAATVYHEAQQAAQAGQLDTAVADYRRVASVAPQSPIVAKAQFDGASLLLKNRRWHAAINELLRFRQNYPKDPLSARIPEKLIYAYEQSSQPRLAADELMKWSASAKSDSAEQWNRRLNAANLYEKAGLRDKANQVYREYLAQGPAPATAEDHAFRQSTRMALADYAGNQGRPDRVDHWYREIVRHENHSTLTNDHSAMIASNAALHLANQARDSFDKVKLTLPLKRALVRKREALERAVKAYQQVEKFGVADAVTQSTYALGQLYRQLARDLNQSQRPRGLNAKELDQYNMLLQEQAYPFQNKAIAFFRQNQKRIPQGIYNQWTRKSLSALAELYPARYARSEQWMGWVDAKLQ